jgi:hypothetical protein
MYALDEEVASGLSSFSNLQFFVLGIHPRLLQLLVTTHSRHSPPVIATPCILGPDFPMPTRLRLRLQSYHLHLRSSSYHSAMLCKHGSTRRGNLINFDNEVPESVLKTIGTSIDIINFHLRCAFSPECAISNLTFR